MNHCFAEDFTPRLGDHPFSSVFRLPICSVMSKDLPGGCSGLNQVLDPCLRKQRRPGREPLPRSLSLLIAARFVLALLLLFCPVAAKGQSKAFFYGDAKADALIWQGLRLSYNLEYVSADRVWDELIRMYPEHPAGYVYKAALVWWKCTGDRQNESLHTLFDSLTKLAIQKGTTWIEKNPNDKQGFAYLASAYGNASRFNVTVTHSYLAALRNGKKAMKYIEIAHQLDPNFYDTYVGLGAYNYFTGALPGVIKPFAWLLGARGNKDEGIKQLLMAAEKGEYARTEAKIVLLSVYYSERRWDDYQQLLESLMEQFPQNNILYMWATNNYIGMKRWDQGIAFFSKLEKEIPADEGQYHKTARAWLDYNLGRNYGAKMDWSGALDVLNQSEKLAGNNSVLLPQVYLLKGNVLDKLNRRDEAVTCYQKVLQYPSVEDSQARAKHFLKSPF